MTYRSPGVPRNVTAVWFPRSPGAVSATEIRRRYAAGELEVLRERVPLPTFRLLAAGDAPATTTRTLVHSPTSGGA